MLSALVLRGHLVHFIVFGIPVAGLVGAVGMSEIRGRWATRSGSEARVDARSGSAERLDGRSAGLRMAAGGLLAAAAIHAVVIPEHFHEYVLYGVFFTALAAGQILLAVLVTRRPDYRTVRYIAIGSAWVVVLWLVSRTSGVPIGPEPWQPESFGGLDIAATCAELLTLVGCVTQLWTVSHHRRLSAHRPAGLTR